MIVLGIEATAHTFGAGVVESQARTAGAVDMRNTRVLCNEFDRYPSSADGFIPRKLADHHAKVALKVVRAALQKAGVGIRDVDAIAFSQGPGIGACLRIGYVCAKSLSTLNSKPLVPVNHTVAHVEVGKWACNCKDPLVVYVSGGNTQIAAKQKQDGKSYYRVLGETLDVGIGNFLDVVGRKINLSPPDAVGVMKTAQQYCRAQKGKPEYFELPYTVKGMNLAFSGLQTAVLRAHAQNACSVGQLCYSAQETAFAMLVEASERALCHTRKPQVLMVGGVAKNDRLREMYSLMCKEQQTRFEAVPFEYAGDQGAMIAVAGLKNILAKATNKSVEPTQDLRLDSQEITW